MARWQRATGGGVSVVAALFEESDGSKAVHLEAYEVSKQLEELVGRGWVDAAPGGRAAGAPVDRATLTVRNPEAPHDATPLLLRNKDVDTAEVEWFLVAVPIRGAGGESKNEGENAASATGTQPPTGHRLRDNGKAATSAAPAAPSPLTPKPKKLALRTSFPVENRLTGQSNADLRATLRGGKLEDVILDFHLLLWLARTGILDIDSDLPAVVHAAKTPGGKILDGHRMLIEGLAQSG